MNDHENRRVRLRYTATGALAALATVGGIAGDRRPGRKAGGQGPVLRRAGGGRGDQDAAPGVPRAWQDERATAGTQPAAVVPERGPAARRRRHDHRVGGSGGRSRDPGREGRYGHARGQRIHAGSAPGGPAGAREREARTRARGVGTSVGKGACQGRLKAGHKTALRPESARGQPGVVAYSRKQRVDIARGDRRGLS